MNLYPSRTLVVLTALSASACGGGDFDDASSEDGEVASVAQSANGFVTREADIAYAASKDVFLSVWHEGKQGDFNIAGALVHANGAVVHGPFMISTAKDDQVAAAVASDGKNFLVTWDDSRNGSDDIFGCMVTGAGQVVHPAGFPIEGGGHGSRDPDVAFSGGSYVVVWEDARHGGGDIYGSRVSIAGAVRDPAGVAVSVQANDDVLPAIEGNGDKFLVGWSTFSGLATGFDIQGTIVKLDPQILTTGLVTIGSSVEHEFSVGIASDGNDFCTVWQRGPLLDAEINSRSVSEAGALGGRGEVLPPAHTTAIRPSVAFVDQRYHAGWTQHPIAPGLNGELHGIGLLGCDPVGQPYAITTLRSRDTAMQLASDGNVVVSAWTDDNPSGSDCFTCAEVRNEDTSNAVPEFTIR